MGAGGGRGGRVRGEQEGRVQGGGSRKRRAGAGVGARVRGAGVSKRGQ